ncbi:MAG TPA: hypothetical protein VGO67_00130 [Verrucomicrobiae bacterium]
MDPLDLTIDGPGYFVVRDPDTGVMSAPRFGDFSLDANGFVVTDFGKRLQGYTNSAQIGIGDLHVGSCGIASPSDWLRTSSLAPSIWLLQSPVRSSDSKLYYPPAGSRSIQCMRSTVTSISLHSQMPYTTSGSLLHYIAEHNPDAKSEWESAIADCKRYYCTGSSLVVHLITLMAALQVSSNVCMF